MPNIQVLWPYGSYDFGNGLPIIYEYGTTVTDAEFDAIAAKVLTIVPKLRPEIRLVGDVNPPPQVIMATEDWVLDQLTALAVAGIPAIKFHQTAPAATWTISHNRNNKPDVVLLSDDDGNERVFTDVSYPDDATVVVEWPSPTTGWAYIQ